MSKLRHMGFALTAALAIAAAGPAFAQSAQVTLKAADGKDVGTAALSAIPNGVLVTLSVKGLPPGEPPFTTAGGHFNPASKKHGLMVGEGAHAGDMPNLHVPASGELTIEVVNTLVTLEKGKANSVYQPDGTALVIHAGKDDYKSDPAGNAGDRIACGVIQ